MNLSFALQHLAVVIYSIIVAAGCRNEHRGKPINRFGTLTENGDTIGYQADQAFAVRDMHTGKVLMVDGYNPFVRVWQQKALIDTVNINSRDFFDFSLFDSTFIIVEGYYGGNTGTRDTYIFCVADGVLQTAASFTSKTHAPSDSPGDGYLVELRWSREKPYRLQLTESFSNSELIAARSTKADAKWSRQLFWEFDSSSCRFKGEELRGPTW
jgi:hypothetical protein